MTLKGALSLKGSVGFAQNQPSLILQNTDFGNFDLVFENEKLLVSGKGLDIKKIATFTEQWQAY